MKDKLCTRTSHSILAPLASLILLGTCLDGTAQTATFSDGTFDDANWVLATVFNSTAPGESSSTASQAVTGGNPGSFRSTTLMFGHGTLAVSQMNKLAIFNPATQGAITSIDYSYDFLKLFPKGFGAINYMIAVQQGGILYVGPGEAPGSETWTTYRHPGLVVTDFVNISPSSFFGGTAHPDFSATASPLQFGYVTLNDNPGPEATSTSGIDNWTVQIHAVPPIPWLSIVVSKVKVTEHIVVGKNYVLESSNDLKTWTSVGVPFIAQTEELTQEFDVGVVGKYYRIREVP